jgi:predicted methyltransferase
LAAVAGDWRSADNKSRDKYRHPVESLTFWGLAPGMTVLEVQPGGGWWTEILAPYAQRTGGRFYATAVDLSNPEVPEAARKSRAEFEQRYAAKPDLYGKIELVNWGLKSAPLPANTFDFILTARSVHGWIRSPGMVEKAFRDFAGALKPGGILAVEQHRANPGPQDPKAVSGYVTEAFVIEQAEKAGLELAARSEINANPKDTKDHPFGVWTLPPTLRSTAYGSDATDPSFDHSKYLAIGESDRMTLKFVKPK